jgi:hypothetical protein
LAHKLASLSGRICGIYCVRAHRPFVGLLWVGVDSVAES